MASDVARICETFLRDVRSIHPEIDPDRLKASLERYGRRFRELDEDESGDLDLEEIKKEVGSQKTPEELKLLISRVDDDNTGTLRLREFLNLMLIMDKVLENPVPDVKPERVGPVGGRRHGAVKKKKRGFIKLQASIKKAGSNYELTVKVVQARELLPMDYNGKSDPFVKLYVQPDPKKKSKKKTAVKKKTLEPQWDEVFAWTVPGSAKLDELRLELTVFDWDRITANDFMGRTSFKLSDVLAEPVDGWYILLDETRGQLYNFQCRDSTTDGTLRVAALTMEPSLALKPSAKPSETHLKETDFQYLKVLGRGNFGKVLLARHRTSSKLVAVKALKKPRIIEEGDLDVTVSERALLIKASECLFLAHLLGAFQTPGNVFFVMDFYSGGDLMFHTLRQGRLSEHLTSFYVAEIALGLFFLHQHKIIYRDLKLDNVMLDGTGHVHIADFGLAKDLSSSPTGKTNTFCGTPNYLAPEVVRNQFYGDETDWWSLGVMTYEMLTGEALFDGVDPDPDRAEQKLYEQILSKHLNFPRTLSEPSRKLLEGFLQREPTKRLGFGGESGERAIRAHAFFAPHNWTALEARTAKAPYVPAAGAPEAAANFDVEFTSAAPNVTPEHPTAISTVPQDVFRHFSFDSGRL